MSQLLLIESRLNNNLVFLSVHAIYQGYWLIKICICNTMLDKLPYYFSSTPQNVEPLHPNLNIMIIEENFYIKHKSSEQLKDNFFVANSGA